MAGDALLMQMSFVREGSPLKDMRCKLEGRPRLTSLLWGGGSVEGQLWSLMGSGSTPQSFSLRSCILYPVSHI